MSLNPLRALAQKEKLAAAMQCSEHRLQEMRREYESSLKSLETEVEALQKEKDELHQRQRNAVASEAASKVSERASELNWGDKSRSRKD